MSKYKGSQKLFLNHKPKITIDHCNLQLIDRIVVDCVRTWLMLIKNHENEVITKHKIKSTVGINVQPRHRSIETRLPRSVRFDPNLTYSPAYPLVSATSYVRSSSRHLVRTLGSFTPSLTTISRQYALAQAEARVGTAYCRGVTSGATMRALCSTPRQVLFYVQMYAMSNTMIAQMSTKFYRLKRYGKQLQAYFSNLYILTEQVVLALVLINSSILRYQVSYHHLML